jgi:hypothetical protein
MEPRDPLRPAAFGRFHVGGTGGDGRTPFDGQFVVTEDSDVFVVTDDDDDVFVTWGET